jgi:cytochrome o ubiquinol oxidase subunit 1
VLAKQDLPGRPHKYEPIEVPQNTPTGVVTAFFAVITGFALIWHIWWMAGVGLLGATVTLLAFMFRVEDEVEISAEQVGQFDRAHAVEVSL